MATGSVGNIAVTKRSKSLINGSATNDVAYTCPAGSYSDVYIEGVSTTGTTGSTALVSFTVNLFILTGNKTRVINLGGLSTFSSAVSTFARQIVYAQGGLAFRDTTAAYISHRLVDGTYFTQGYDYQSNPTLDPPHKIGAVFRLFPGDYIALTYNSNATTSNGVNTFEITTLEVTSSV